MSPGHVKILPGRGFTLLELMVVMVIAGLMISLVPPLFSGAIGGTRLKSSARDLAVLLRETRSRAILHNTEQRVHLDLKNASYRVGDSKPLSLPENVAMSVELITGAYVEQTAQHVIRFFPDGSSSGEMITLNGGNTVYHLQLNWLTGEITINSQTSNAG